MTAPLPSRGGAAARAWVRMGILAAAVLGLDQATKALVRGALARGEEVELGLGFELVSVRNPGIAFGLLDGGGAALLVVIAITLAVLLAWFASDPARRGLWVAIGLVLGGALGNVVDRVHAGEVTDFLDPPLWPAFNLADVGITGGVLILVALALADGDEATGER